MIGISGESFSATRRKICFIAGADSIHAYRWVRHFARQGHDVSWITLYPETMDQLPGVPRYRIACSRRLSVGTLFALLRVRRLIRQISPDLVHAHYAGINGLAGIVSGIRPFVLTGWGSDVLLARSGTHRFIAKAGLRRADRVTCDAEHMRAAIERLGVDHEKIDVIFFGTDVQEFSVAARSDEVRAGWGVTGPVVISARRFEPVHDVVTLIEAIPMVLDKFPDTTFVLAGGGPLADEIVARATDLGVVDSVRFLGAVPVSELPRIFASADVYVSTSLSDAGLSASTAEAMACEIPVVVTATGENHRWVTEGENGFIVPVSNPRALADRILSLLGDPSLRARMGAANRRVIETRNNFAVEMDKVEVLYRALVDKFRQASA